MRQGGLRAKLDVDEGTPLWPRGFSAWIRVGVLYAKTTRELTLRLRPLGLTVAQFDALAHLFVEDGISQQDLAERLLVTKGNVTGLVNRLADHELVTRRVDPKDRRTNRLELTRAGKRVAKKALEVQAELVRGMMGQLSEAEQRTLSGLLGRVAAHFD